MYEQVTIFYCYQLFFSHDHGGNLAGVRYYDINYFCFYLIFNFFSVVDKNMNEFDLMLSTMYEHATNYIVSLSSS